MKLFFAFTFPYSYSNFVECFGLKHLFCLLVSFSNNFTFCALGISHFTTTI